MLTRISGGTQGIKEYLENGQKQGRDFSRDELDERVILSGDLEATDAIIQRMDNDGEKYLHVTIAFKEDEIDRETLTAVVREFESFTFAAYDQDEYSFYAEAHMPRVKSYTNEQSGEFIERKPHIHVVIPKTNLLSEQHLNPFGVVEQNERFIDSFQEHINNKFGLASPKENRRLEFTGESEMISRYKGDVFEGQSKDLKGNILETMLTRKVDKYEDFKALLSEFGETKARNAGKEAEYQNVKAPESGKGVNLKEYVFSREFVELPDADKRKRLAADVQHKYETAGPPRKTPEELEANLKEWRQVRAKEVKYINSGNRKAYQEYREADKDGRKALLDAREARFYAKHRQEKNHATDKTTGTDRAARYDREYGYKRGAGRSIGAGRNDSVTNERGAANNRQRNPKPFGQKAPAQSLNSVRNLSSISVVSFAQRGEVFLQNHAPNQLEHSGAEPANGVRRPTDSERRVTPTGRQADNVTSQLARDQQERKQGRSTESQNEFQEIKARLDARRLLAELSQSHGVIPDKYEVTKAKDGSDRIKSGTRNLNVSDFLTKELNMPWKEAAKTMRDSYTRQRGKEPEQEAKREPRRQLWVEFQEDRKAKGMQQRSAQWDEQRMKERTSRDSIKKEFYAKRSKAQGDRSLKPAERKAAVSIARMERLAKEAALRERVAIEREKMKAEQKKPAREQYREFLTDKAQGGDEQALAELRRMRPEPAEKEKETDALVKPAERQTEQDRAPIQRAQAITYQVSRNGDVTYKRAGREVLRDAGRNVQMLQQDAQTIETGLRLAQQKFGSKLALSGPQDFQEKAARIAAEAGLKVEFTDQRLNKIMQDRRTELDAEKVRQGEARKLAQDFAKEQTQEKSKAKVPAQPAESQKEKEQTAPAIKSKEPNTEHSRYSGEVQAIDAQHVYQRHGQDIIRHDRKQFSEAPKPGDQVQVTYRQGKATVKNLGQEREVSNDKSHGL